MKEFDIANWNRKEVYNAFSKLDFPFYHVVFQLDVTRLKQFTAKRGLSFYYSMVWLATRAADSVLNFRLRIMNGKLYDVEKSIPMIAFLKPGAEVFQNVVCSLSETIEEYTAKVRALTEGQTAHMGGENAPEHQKIFFSCLPWMEVTALSSERALDPDESTPRIGWGKYVTRDGRLQTSVSVDANHRLIDGFHIGQFYRELQKTINELPD